MGVVSQMFEFDAVTIAEAMAAAWAMEQVWFWASKAKAKFTPAVAGA